MGLFNTRDALRPRSSAASMEGTTDLSSAATSVKENEKKMDAPSEAIEERQNSAEEYSELPLGEKIKEATQVAVAQDSSAEDGSDDVEYPAGWKLALITIALCLSVFCMALDNTIIATAIPRITDQFKALNDVGWYGSAYLLTTCAFQLVYGKIYTMLSIKWTYMVALFIFELGSFICGIAPNSTALIVGRAVAGLGSAGVFSGAILIVAHTVPLRQRPTYTGMIGAMYGIASVAGPLMGGAFTDRLTWRWCFYINLPFGAVTALFILFFFKSPKHAVRTRFTSWKQTLAQFDLLGTAVFLPGVICLLLALQWGGSMYAWGNWRIIMLFVFFAILIAAFIGIQIWKKENATVPPRVFKNRNVWASAWFGACLGAAFFVFVFYLPIWFQAIKGASAVKSGIMNLPLILGLVIISILAGIGVTILGYYTPFMYAATILMSIGAGLLTTFTTDSGSGQWIGYQALFGIGCGFGMQQTLIAVQASVEPADIPIGTAIMMFSQTLGGALFISVAQNVFSNQLIKNIMHEIPGFKDIGIVLAAGATELQHAVTELNPDYLQPVLTAYNNALTQTWYVAVAMSVLSAVPVAFIQWKSVKGKKIEVAGGA